MTLKIEFDQPKGKVILECKDGINVILDGPYEDVDSKHLEEALMFIVRILRLTNDEIDYLDIIITKEQFNKNKKAEKDYHSHEISTMKNMFDNFSDKCAKIIDSAFRTKKEEKDD